MDSIEAIACDMNSDFEEAFEIKCPWIQPIFDHFLIVKNLNDKVSVRYVRMSSAACMKKGLRKKKKL